VRRAAGFTLLEVIISLTITSLIAVMAYGALRLGARATQRGEEKKDEDQRTRALLSLVRRQLKSAYAYPLTDQGDSFVYFFGDRESLTFISSASWPDAGGFEKIAYGLREDNGDKELWIRASSPVLPADLLEDREGIFVEETMALAGIEEISWEYLWRLGNNTEWRSQWIGSDERTLPAAVRLTWRARASGALGSWEMVVPIMARGQPGLAPGGVGGGRLRERLPRFGGDSPMRTPGQ